MARWANTGLWDLVHRAACGRRTRRSFAFAFAFASAFTLACDSGTGPSDDDPPDEDTPPVVVFEMVREGARDIYRVGLEGGEPVRLTSSQHDNRSPTVAAGRVVFTSFRDGNGELYSVPLAGGEETRLTNTPAHETEAALSSDGTRLAFTRASSGGVPKLWTGSGVGGNLVRAVEDLGHPGSIEAAPSWSPGGDRIVFVSTASGNADLYIFTPATGEVELLLGTDAPEVEPAWSPDGEWVAFASARDGQTDLFRIHVETGEVERLTDRAETDARPTWLPDGRIVYVARVDGATRLRWLDPDDLGTVHEIPVGEGTIGRVSAAR